MNRRGLKIKPHIELPRLVVQSMHQDRTDRNDIRGGYGSCERILEQGAPQTCALLRIINSEPGQKHDADGMIWCTLSYPHRSVMSIDAAGGQGVITHYAIAAMNNIRGCEIALLIGPCELLQPLVERLNSAREWAQIVLLRELFRPI